MGIVWYLVGVLTGAQPEGLDGGERCDGDVRKRSKKELSFFTKEARKDDGVRSPTAATSDTLPFVGVTGAVRRCDAQVLSPEREDSGSDELGSLVSNPAT